MTQEIITYIIGGVVAGILIHRVYNLVRRSSERNKCSGCSGCGLKREFDKKKQSCKEWQPRAKNLNNKS